MKQASKTAQDIIDEIGCDEKTANEVLKFLDMLNEIEDTIEAEAMQKRFTGPKVHMLIEKSAMTDGQILYVCPECGLTVSKKVRDEVYTVYSEGRLMDPDIMHLYTVMLDPESEKAGPVPF